MRSGTHAAEDQSSHGSEALPYDPAEWEARLAKARARREAVLREKQAGQGAKGPARADKGAAQGGASDPVPFPARSAKAASPASGPAPQPHARDWRRRIAEARGLPAGPTRTDEPFQAEQETRNDRPHPVLPATLPLAIDRAQASRRTARKPSRRPAVSALVGALLVAGIGALAAVGDPDRLAALEAMPGAALNSARSAWEAATDGIGLSEQQQVNGLLASAPWPIEPTAAPVALATPPAAERPVLTREMTVSPAPEIPDRDAPAPPADPTRADAPPVASGAVTAFEPVASRAAPQPRQRPVEQGAAATGPDVPRIVVHVPPQLSDAALASSVRAALTGDAARLVDVAMEIDQTHLRYFHSGDRIAAAELGRRLGVPVRSFTEYRPSPAPGLVEVWLAGGPQE